jgi:hypothetical protein
MYYCDIILYIIHLELYTKVMVYYGVVYYIIWK